MAWKQALKAWRILVFFFVPIILLPFPLVIGTQVISWFDNLKPVRLKCTEINSLTKKSSDIVAGQVYP
jgi:hypothetical protein